MCDRRISKSRAGLPTAIFFTAFATLSLAMGVRGSCQSAPPKTPATASSDEALAWDRDFDLLLELKKSQTKAEGEAAARRAGLLKEKETFQAGLTDFRFRLSSIEGTYTTEAILNEMLRQEVSDMQLARENLRGWIKRDEAQVREIDAQLKHLSLAEPP